MTSLYKLLSILLASVALFVGGCAREGPLSSDPKIAVRQANELVPKGTSEARAEEILKERGFQCSELRSERAVNYLLVGTYTKEEKTWQIGVSIRDGKAEFCSVTVSDGSSFSGGL